MKKKALSILVVVFLFASASVYFLYPPTANPIKFPNGKLFAFTIVDDTDMATLDDIEPIYDLLHEYGFRTTKTVWVLDSTERDHPPNRGDSLQNANYRRFIFDLQQKGFEIALHGVRGGTSNRDDILAGLNQFQEILGQYPKMHINHSLNRDNVYWGKDRMSFGPYNWLQAVVSPVRFSGHDPASPHFWGDATKQHIQYVRRFTFPDINLLRINPSFPYHLPGKEYVNYWFPTSNGNNADDFIELIGKENLDQLEREGGICIVYTHFGAGSFYRNGQIRPEFESRIKDLSTRNGWFVPATELLDYIRSQPGWDPDLTFRERVRLESIFLIDRIFQPPD